MKKMNSIVISALISGSFSLVGIFLSSFLTNLKTQQKNAKNQAVIKYEIEELTREVRAHNNFATRVPVLEAKVENLERRERDD